MEDYVENVLGNSIYRIVKEGGVLPIYVCPECGVDTFVFDDVYLCFSCGYTISSTQLGFCYECNAPYIPDDVDDLGICFECIGYRLEKD